MRLRVTVMDEAADGRRTDVTVDGPPDAPAAAVLEEVARAAECRLPLWTARGQFHLDGSFADLGVHDGEVLATRGPAPAVRDQVASGIELRVTGGPGAGMVVRLRPGRTVIGRHPSCTVAIPDPELSRQHAAIDLSPDGTAAITDLGSSNGTAVEGSSVGTSPEPLRHDQLVQLGSTYVELRPVVPVDGVLVDDGECGFVFNRQYRIHKPSEPVEVEFPTAPREEERPGFPWLMMGAPLVVAVAMAAILKQPEYLLLAVMSPVMTLGSVVHDRQGRKRRVAREAAAFEQESADAGRRLTEAGQDERRNRRAATPDPASVVLAATGPRGQLWERRPDDDDWLRLRVGLATQPSTVGVVNHEAPPPAWSVPVAVAVTDAKVVGLAAPPEAARALARALLLQAAVLHSPDELRVVVLTDPETQSDWDWLRWLPHAQQDQAAGVIAVGNDSETVSARLRELQQAITGRAEGSGDRRAGHDRPLPQYLVVVDGARRLRSVPGMLTVLRDGPPVGVWSLCLDRTRGLLPEESGAVVVWDEADGQATVEQHGRAPVPEVTVDRVSVPLCEVAARAMAPIHRVGGESGTGLPPSARLVELAELEPPTAEVVAARWRTPGRGPRALLGAAEHGPLVLDLATDGPHGLVAGTTGSGKSELLQTLVAGLAVSLPPDELNVVLVDYKGGAAFRECQDLPHAVGMVSDLDAHLTERALRSLQAELKRRELALAQVGAKDIDDYLEARARSGDDRPALGRLVIVIDEFATLAVDLPDFLKGLVGIAQRGRSLGVHLVLATQRPTGVVSPEIRANTNFAVALRVVNGSESSDVIGTTDAATISPATPGRAYLRISQEPPVCFQAARVGGRRPGTVDDAAAGAVRAIAAPWSSLGRPDPRPPAPPAVSDAVTDLHLLATAVRGAASQAWPIPPHRPWLDPLPEVVTLDEVERVDQRGRDGQPGGAAGSAASGGSGDVLVPVPFGLLDLPDLQAQAPLAFDPAAGRHLLAAGSPRSGRSSLLLSLAAALVRNAGSSDVHVYGLDCGRGSLLPLRNLPHCGAVVMRQEADRAERLLDRLAAEIRLRQTALVEDGLTSIVEQRARAGRGGRDGSPRWPYAVLLVDGWEGFVDAFHDHKDGQVEQLLLSVLRDGAPVGVLVAMTGDRSLLATSRVSSLFEDRLVLRFNDRDDYSLADLAPRRMPESVPPGRAFRAVSGEELQVALLCEDPAGPALAAALADLVATAREREAGAPPGPRPIRVDALPARISRSEAEAMAKEQASGAGDAHSALTVLAGVGGDELSPWWVDLAQVGPGFVVTGAPESGRSTALLSMAELLLAGGCGVVAVTPRPGPLADGLAGRDGTAVLQGPDAQSPAAAGQDWAEKWGARPLAILVDDAELVDPDDVWLTAVASGPPGDRALVIAGGLEPLRDGFRGFPLHARRHGCGLLLSPRTHLDASVFNGTLPRGAGFTGPAGRAYLFARGRPLTLLQVPQPG